MNLFVQQVVIGLSIGSVYALLAVGYALITSIFNFTNFGYGSVMMCGAFAAYFAVVKLGFSTLLAPGENRHFGPGGKSQFRPDENRQLNLRECSQLPAGL